MRQRRETQEIYYFENWMRWKVVMLKYCISKNKRNNFKRKKKIKGVLLEGNKMSGCIP